MKEKNKMLFWGNMALVIFGIFNFTIIYQTDHCAFRYGSK